MSAADLSPRQNNILDQHQQISRQRVISSVGAPAAGGVNYAAPGRAMRWKGEAVLDEITSRGMLFQAFDRVRENGGCRGAYGVTLGDFADHLEQELDNLQDRLLRRRYHPYPLLRFEVPKSESKIRRLCVPTVRDRVLQTAVYLATRPLFEAEFEACSYAYREGRSVRVEVGVALISTEGLRPRTRAPSPRCGSRVGVALISAEGLRPFFQDSARKVSRAELELP